jgi:diadenosine tetraphosphate (Ap4A) HIT family hydrolase
LECGGHAAAFHVGAPDLSQNGAPMSACALCRVAQSPAAAGELLLAESAASVSVLHDDWATRGHAMIIARRHVENLSDLEAGERHRFTDDLARTERALLAATGTQRAILMKLGIAVPHLHIHVYPVRATDDRAAVMAMIDGRVRDELTGKPRAMFLQQLRELLIGYG